MRGCTGAGDGRAEKTDRRGRACPVPLPGCQRHKARATIKGPGNLFNGSHVTCEFHRLNVSQVAPSALASVLVGLFLLFPRWDSQRLKILVASTAIL